MMGLKVRQTEKLKSIFRFAEVGYLFCLSLSRKIKYLENVQNIRISDRDL